MRQDVIELYSRVVDKAHVVHDHVVDFPLAIDIVQAVIEREFASHLSLYLRIVVVHMLPDEAGVFDVLDAGQIGALEELGEQSQEILSFFRTPAASFGAE